MLLRGARRGAAFFSGAFSCRGDKARAVWPLYNFTSVDVNRLQLQQAASWCFMNWWCAHPFRRIHIRTKKNNEKTKQGHTANDAWYLHTVAQTLWTSREECIQSRSFIYLYPQIAGEEAACAAGRPMLCLHLQPMVIGIIAFVTTYA